MNVDRATALSTDIAGRRFYFCSERCLHGYERAAHQAHVAAGPRRASQPAGSPQ
jgi:YHS domain-containing protein